MNWSLAIDSIQPVIRFSVQVCYRYDNNEIGINAV